MTRPENREPQDLRPCEIIPDFVGTADGSCLIRVKPMTEEQREASERYVRGLGYQGNNLLCSNWDTDHMDELNYNGMYEYLMKIIRLIHGENLVVVTMRLLFLGLLCRRSSISKKMKMGRLH